MSTTTQRNGTTDYTQIVGPKVTRTTKGGKDKSVGSKKSTETPDLVNVTKGSRLSADYANIGARIQFSVKIIGRFSPAGTNPCP